jgi:hypothetical protein
MPALSTESFDEFKWMPFVVGALALLVLRAVVHGRMGGLLDVVVMFVYFAGFSLWSFGYKLWVYGHHLDPGAPVRVAGFMPPLFGYRKIANFEVYSYPGPAGYAMGAVFVLLLGALVFAAWPRRAPRARA